MAFVERFTSPYFRSDCDDAAGLVRLTRTSEPFPSVVAAREGWLWVVSALDRVGRARRCLLADLRDGPARNDPQFEQAILDVIPRVHAQFLGNAILVRMAMGALQIKRHAKGDGIDRLITSSEAEALAYLQQARVAHRPGG